VNPFCQHSLHSVGHTDKLIDYSKRITSFETLEKKWLLLNYLCGKSQIWG
jgi:hypothetical protein